MLEKTEGATIQRNWQY